MDGWLHCISARGDKGLVPATYVRMLAPGEHAAPPSPPPRTRSRKLSYDFSMQVLSGASHACMTVIWWLSRGVAECWLHHMWLHSKAHPAGLVRQCMHTISQGKRLQAHDTHMQSCLISGLRCRGCKQQHACTL